MSRTDLRFVKLVQEHFAFLLTQGFDCVRSDLTFVRFESSSLFINIYHGRLSFEIGAELGRIENSSDEKQPYPMSALLEFAKVPMAEKYRSYMAHTPEGVDKGLAKLAKLFHDYVSPHLQYAGLFQVLKKQQDARIHKFAQEVELGQMRQKLVIAWNTKNYAKLVELLYPFKNVITLIELHKLKYAEKHVGKPDHD